MAAPVFNCLVFNFRVFQNDCEDEDEVVGGAAPAMILRRYPRENDEIMAVISAFLGVVGRGL